MNFQNNMSMMAHQGMGMPGAPMQQGFQAAPQRLDQQSVINLYRTEQLAAAQQMGNWRANLTPEERFGAVQQLYFLTALPTQDFFSLTVFAV